VSAAWQRLICLGHRPEADGDRVTEREVVRPASAAANSISTTVSGCDAISGIPVGRLRAGGAEQRPSAHAKLRAPGERANAWLKTWHILRELRCCPGVLGRSPKLSTSSNPARPEDEKGSLSLTLTRGRSHAIDKYRHLKGDDLWPIWFCPMRHLLQLTSMSSR
jgi:hypothetical protein